MPINVNREIAESPGGDIQNKKRSPANTLIKFVCVMQNLL